MNANILFALLALSPRIIELVQEILKIFEDQAVASVAQGAGISEQDARKKVQAWIADPSTVDSEQVQAWMERASQPTNG